MFEDNYLFKDQVLEILTKNLRIRIYKTDERFEALCYFRLPLLYDKDEKFELDLANRLVLKASTLERPLFIIYFEEEPNIPKMNYLDDKLYWYHEEARNAILLSLLWKEYWIS